MYFLLDLIFGTEEAGKLVLYIMRSTAKAEPQPESGAWESSKRISFVFLMKMDSPSSSNIINSLVKTVARGAADSVLSYVGGGDAISSTRKLRSSAGNVLLDVERSLKRTRPKDACVRPLILTGNASWNLIRSVAVK